MTMVATTVDALIARSRRLGADPRTTNFAGGNTSAKGQATDPATGDLVDLLWVKGSGGDLGTLTVDGLAVLRLDRVRGLVDVYPGVDLSGRITMIGAKADEAHTYPVEVTVSNSSDHPLRAGMFGRVQFTSIPHKSALMVPREAVVGSVKQAQVYVVNNGIAKLRDVVLGAEEGTSVEVISGLLEGDQVVVSGQNSLRDNVQVSVVSTR